MALARDGGGGGDASPTPASPGPVLVVTTTAILADLARNVGGDAVEVRSLVGLGSDVHSFQSTPGDSIAIREARLILTNGGGLDAALDPIIDGAKASDTTVVEAAEALKADPIGSMPAATGDGGTTFPQMNDDPHLWLNPQFAIGYVALIRDAMIGADPARTETYRRNADAYIQELTRLDSEIEATLATIPRQRRRLVTFHDAFGHFARRYGFAVSALTGVQAGDVTPGAVRAIVDQIRAEGIPAIFAERQFNQDVLRQVARDAGVRVGFISSDVLTEETPTYVEMMRANAVTLAELLGDEPGR